MTTDMVRLATRNAKVMKLNNVVFLLGEMERLPLAPDLADVVISNCVICLSTDKDELFRDAFRVLKPGGRMHISDMLLEHGELPQEIKNEKNLDFHASVGKVCHCKAKWGSSG